MISVFTRALNLQVFILSLCRTRLFALLSSLLICHTSPTNKLYWNSKCYIHQSIKRNLHSNIFHRAFAVSAPSAWNSLPIDIRDCSSDATFNPLKGRSNYIATSNNMKLVHWPLMGGLLHLVQRGGDWAGPQPAQAPPRWKLYLN